MDHLRPRLLAEVAEVLDLPVRLRAQVEAVQWEKLP